jgi:hypothetical protein
MISSFMVTGFVTLKSEARKYTIISDIENAINLGTPYLKLSYHHFTVDPLPL